MFYSASKILWVLAQPSNLLLLRLVAGALAMMRASTGRLAILKGGALGQTKRLLVSAGFRSRDAIVVYTFFKLVMPLVFLAGAALFGGKEWGRWFALVAVIVNMVGQLAWFPAYPLWSLVAIGLGVTVLFALTARWRPAKAELRS